VTATLGSTSSSTSDPKKSTGPHELGGGQTPSPQFDGGGSPGPSIAKFLRGEYRDSSRTRKETETPGGNQTIVSAPTSATLGATGNGERVWTGVTTGQWHLGAVSHNRGSEVLGLTLLDVDNRS